MAYEFLKKLFGTAEDGETPKSMTYEELEKAIDADKGISIVNLKEGGYVSKEKFDAKDVELSGVKQQLSDANTEIQSYKDMDVDGIKKSVDDWKTKYDADTKKLQDQLTAQERSYAESMFLSGYQFTSKAARKGVLEELREKNFKIENGQLQGAKDFMTGLMENEEYKGAFKVETKPETKEPEKEPGAGAPVQSASGNIYTGAQPRFTASTNGGVGSDGNAPKFNFGFTHINEKK